MHVRYLYSQVLKVLIMRKRTKPFSALKWTITLNSQIIMNNGLTIGVPAMASMYGPEISQFAVCCARYLYMKLLRILERACSAMLLGSLNPRTVADSVAVRCAP